MPKLFQAAFISTILVIVATYLSLIIQPAQHALEINWFWLPTGAAVLAFLLFDNDAFYGVAIGSFISGILFFDSWSALSGLKYGASEAIIAATAPLLALASMKKLDLSKFFHARKVNFRHVVFLVILSATYEALFKFSYFLSVIDSNLDPSLVMRNYLVSGIIGGICLVIFVLKIVDILLSKLK